MSNLDGATAGLMVAAIKNANSNNDLNQMSDLMKQIKSAPEEGPTDEQVEMVNALTGKRVIVADCIGRVIGLNNSNRGFYPGGRYPAYIKLETALDTRRCRAVGCTFEYGLEQVEVYIDDGHYNIDGIELRCDNTKNLHKVIYKDPDGDRTTLVGLDYEMANKGLRDSIKEINDSRLLDVYLKEIDVSFMDDKVYFGFKSKRTLKDITMTLDDLTSLLEYEMKIKGLT